MIVTDKQRTATKEKQRGRKTNVEGRRREKTPETDVDGGGSKERT